MKNKPTVAFFIQTEVQFFSLAPLIYESMKLGDFDVVVLVDEFKNVDGGFAYMAAEVAESMRKGGIVPKVLSDFSNDYMFDICLLPYMNVGVKARCYLKYEYGTLNVKPNLTYTPKLLGGIHGFLCQSSITATLLAAYGMTFPVDNLRFVNVKKHQFKIRKKVVLFAPTYNDVEDERELANIIIELKKEYYVVVKGHHGMQHLDKNKDKKNILIELSDEYYKSDTNLSSLILGADVCLFDNSSAIAEAMYVNIPCSMVTKDPNGFSLDGIDTTQFKMVRDEIIPCCKNSKGVIDVLKRALSDEYRKKQKEAARLLLPKEYRTGVDGYIKVIRSILFDETMQDYIRLYDFIANERQSHLDVLHDEIMELHKVIEQQKECIKQKQDLLDDFAKRKLYKVADKIYEIEGRILNGKG